MTRFATDTPGPGVTPQSTQVPLPSPTRRSLDTRWPTVTRRAVDTRWPTATRWPTSTRWPTASRGGSVTPRPTASPTPAATLPPSPTLTSPPAGGWSRYHSALADFEFYYPSDSSVAIADEGRAQIYFPVTPGTNLAAKYLELYISDPSAACPANFAGSPAGEATLNGIRFQVGTGEEAGAGQLREYTTYSTQQGEACISFTFVLHSGSIGAYPPGTVEFDRAVESALFPLILETFRLLAPPPTPTPAATATITQTATRTPTPTRTTVPSATRSPTFDFPKVTVSVANAACRFGPSTAYLWGRDLHQGDTGVVWGRAANSTWLYVRMDRLDIPCWVAPSVVTVDGDVRRVAIQPVRLPITNALYGPPTNVRAVRSGGQVTVSWDAVWMTADDDRGYFLDVFVCQNGIFVWVPVAKANQYQTSHTFTDGPGCSPRSGGQLYTVEKHGYTSPVNIPWP
jgi:hypothetical protein